MGYYSNQLKALVKRNILLKKASKIRTFFEIFLPILMVVITYLVNKISETKVYPAMDPTGTININDVFRQFSMAMQYQSKVPTIGIVLPESSKDTTIINKIKENDMFVNSPFEFRNFENQDQMNEYNNDFHNLLLAGIIFESDDLFHYTIRVNSTTAPEPNADDITNYIEGRYKSENGEIEADTYSYVFSPIQAAVDQAIIRLKAKDDTITLKHNIGKLGKAASEYDLTDNAGNLGFYVSMIFMMPVIVIAVSLVKEKEDGIKNGLLMAGTHPTLFWLSWLSLYVAICLFVSVIITIIFHFSGTFSNVNIIIMILTLLLYGLSCCNLAFVFSAFFKRTKTAGTVISIIIVFFSYANMALPFISLTVRKIVSLFLCQITIGSFIYEVDALENHFQKLSFSNIFTSNAGYFFLMLIINNILYFVLGLLFDNLFSTEDSQYLFKFNKKIDVSGEEDENTNEKDVQEDFNFKNGAKCIAEVDHVYKVFPKKIDREDEKKSMEKSKENKNQFLAVNNVSFKVYENEIFAILGHNGAGKTTLINIMVGLLRASKGGVYYDGLDIAKDTNTIRKNFGVCAQTNTIFDELTVEDHIKFIADLKDVQVDVDEVLTEIDLIHQKNLKASKLSGGQKRKLCIGMATIGNPKYVFLDEPTTGLDPLSRRKIWDLLLKKKKGRVIFLTTHYMDEADILADRKLILSKGKIRCLGTSLFLKNHFNMCYNLDVETSDKERIHSIIQHHLTDFTYVRNQNKEDDSSGEKNKTSNNYGIECHTWRLPLNATDKYALLLNDLEGQMNQQNGLVQKYALNMPTLEELFIRLEDHSITAVEDEDTKEEMSGQEHFRIQMDTELPKLKPVQKPNSLFLIFSLVKSRIKIFTKDKVFTFFAILFPAIATGVMFFIANKIFNGDPKPTESRVLSVQNVYGNTYLNYEPQSQLHLSKENILVGTGIHDNMLSSHSLTEIPNPEIGGTYYLSSLGGQEVENTYDLQIHYNDTMTHALPATFNAISNAILASKNIDGRIVTTSHTFAKGDDTMAIVSLSLAGFMIGYYISNNINRFGPLVVRERSNQLLQQLQLNGVSRLNYWISCFISDILLFIITCILIFIIGLLVRYEPLMDFKIIVIIFILLIIWSVASMLFQYVTSFLFEKEDTAFSMSSFINTYPAIFGYIIFILINGKYSVVEGILEGKGILATVPNVYNIVLSALFPSYGFIGMVNSIFTMKVYEKLIHYEIKLSTLLRFDNGILPIIIVHAVQAVLYFLLIINLDRKINQTNKSDIYDIPSGVLQRCQEHLDEGDDDVKKEYEYVKENQFDLPLSVLHLSKEYKASLPSDKEKAAEISARDPQNFTFGEIHKSPVTGKYVKTAVIDVNFGVRNHECFGLLGPNGAGKSTTLNTVTSTIPQTTGKVCFNGVETHIARLGEISMGYCPQNDILWKELTLREHLELFLRIRGYTSQEARDYATRYIDIIGVEEHQNKRADNLSGGTKRKLSLLIAICGYPKQILLDEPSAGMDPSTRRLVWNIIKKTKNMNDSAVIMTTHSMEEAEFLCDRLAILVNGRLSCIGSPEHLKMKFGDSYILELQSKDVERFHHEIIENGKLFGEKEYKMDKSSSDRVKYEVKMTHNIGYVFGIMENCKKSGLVTDYSFNQTTLEQIFINFAKEQIITTE
ncbi:P-loop containing nucleoside triphosphate hydrolase protein [Piromyces finnis]|uniref:p-loop containing nucleoside triphosphate hydrolase protein n=1 Tax=Piromyces finnis TaxID=1754191 RepID=A0A1Y1V7P6_9FUNG|nr:P-loop containing nucleoside triphosphate hydrolase protein [Piromyces finnis]|eukprot:ORX49210.1 P-loop containing nucleoside triphosphate hydrolase protein [Piromyces finnis]